MKIGELASRSGLTQSRIRFYEKIGLLKTVDRRANGYRVYPPTALTVLELIATARFKQSMDRASAATAYTRRITALVVVPAVLAVVAVLIHFFIINLDVAWYVALRRLGM